MVLVFHFRNMFLNLKKNDQFFIKLKKICIISRVNILYYLSLSLSLSLYLSISIPPPIKILAYLQIIKLRFKVRSQNFTIILLHFFNVQKNS